MFFSDVGELPSQGARGCACQRLSFDGAGAKLHLRILADEGLLGPNDARKRSLQPYALMSLIAEPPVTNQSFRRFKLQQAREREREKREREP